MLEFSPKAPGETVTGYYLDFVDHLQAGETLTNATVTCSIPALLLAGSVAWSGTKVSWTITGGNDGDYGVFSVSVTGSLGTTRTATVAISISTTQNGTTIYAVAPVNVGTVITKALTKITGNVSRATLVTWFNEIAEDVMNQPRQWHFLEQPLALQILDNQITIPPYISELFSIQVGESFYTPKDQLTDEEAAESEQNRLAGYTFANDGTVTFYPPKTGTASVAGEQSVLFDYVDNAATIFPLIFENLFIIGLRMHFYDLDKDGRFTKENTLYQLEINKLKAWDNKLKPLPHYNSHGYIRA